MYLIEGPVLLTDAIAAGVVVEELYAEEAVVDDAEVRAVASAGARCHAVRDGALAKVLDQRSPRPVVGVARQQLAATVELVAAARSERRPLLLGVDVADPGNAGTLVRVAEASGCAGFVAVGNGVDVFNPKTVRASAGSLFRLPVAQTDDLLGVADTLNGAGVRMVGTSGRNDAASPVHIDDADLDGAFALLIGNEAHGLPDDLLARCDQRVSIPMHGGVESLNAAVAGAVVLFEAARRRRTPEHGGGAPAALGQNDARSGTTTEDPLDV